MSTTRYELMVEVNGVKHMVDTRDVEPLELQYKINDISDPASLEASFTKTIKLPESSKNRYIFGFTSDLSADSSYNPNLKSRAWILVDSVVVFEGNLQYKITEKNLDENASFIEAVIYSDNKNLFLDIGDKYLTDLDMSFYNHIWNKDNVMYSWTQSQSLGYYYPLIDYGLNYDLSDLKGISATGSFLYSYLNEGLQTESFYPSVYAKTILDRIFAEAGYSYTSAFFDSTYFKNLLVPFNRENMGVDEDFARRGIFRAGRTQSQTINSTFIELTWRGDCYGKFYTEIYGNAPRIAYNDENPPLYDDTYNLWNTTSYYYKHPLTSIGREVVRFQGYIEFDQYGYWTNAGMTVFPYAVDYQLNNAETLLPQYSKVQLIRSRNPDGSTHSSWPNYGNPIQMADGYDGITYEDGNYTIGVNDDYGSGTLTRTYGINYQTDWIDDLIPGGYRLFPGEEVTMVVQRLVTRAPGILFKHLTANKPLTQIKIGSYIESEVKAQLFPGQLIDFNTVLPENVKQRDFILGLQKKFNLIFEPSKTLINNLYIEPYDIYYNSGIQKDWSKKLDTSQPIIVNNLSEAQNKTFILTDKMDDDFYNKDYQSKTNRIYGWFKDEVDNDFVVGTKTIETIFSPTVLVNVPSSNSFILSNMSKELSNGSITDHNIRLISRSPSGLVSLQSPGDFWRYEGLTMSVYPYAGHMYPDPYKPNKDLNFGQLTGGLYYPSTGVTNQTAYERFYKNMWENISDKDAKIITVKMYLNPTDISLFRFNDLIFLEFEGAGQYYTINKITGYDPSKISICTVELIKRININVSRETTKFIPRFPLMNFADMGRQNSELGTHRTIETGGSNIMYGDNSMSLGTFNKINSNALTVGSLNVIGNNSDSSMILGSGNLMPFANGNILSVGNNNTFDANTQGVFAFGSGMGIHTSNQVVYGVPVINYVNIVQSGRGEILSAFPGTKIVNIVSAGRGNIRQIGSTSIETNVTAGNGSIL